MTEKPKDPGRSYNWRDGNGGWTYNETWEQWRTEYGHEQPTNKPPATGGLGSLFGFLFGEKQAQEASEKYRQALKRAQQFLAEQEMQPATAEEEVRLWGKALGVTSGTSAREIN